jgi:hypothetical protein
VARQSDITVAHGLFAGTDKGIRYEIFAPGTSATPPANAAMQNVENWGLEWVMRKLKTGVDPLVDQGAVLLTKSTGGNGITIVGVFNAARNLNQQRVVVALSDEETELFKGGNYYCSLKRTDDGLEDVLSHGYVWISRAPTR